MNRADAYSLLARELSVYDADGYERALELRDKPARTREVWIGDEPVTIEICVTWADEKRRILQVEGVAYGPSSFQLERVRAALILAPGVV